MSPEKIKTRNRLFLEPTEEANKPLVPGNDSSASQCGGKNRKVSSS